MPNLNADEIITQKHKRNYVQWGGPGPGNVVNYAGQDGQYMSIEGVKMSEYGGIDAIWAHDLRTPGRYRLIGRSLTPPDLSEATLLMREKHKLIPRQLTPLKCAFNFYELTGTCKDLSDFLRGWTDYVLIYSLGLVSSKDLGSRSSFDADDAIEDSLSVTLSDIYPAGAIAFCEKGTTQIDKEVVDVVFGSEIKCANCGPADDGTQLVYAVTKSSGSGSPGLPSELIYSTDGGVTIHQTAITGIGVSEDALAVEIVGGYLVVLGLDAYYYAEIDLDTGVPGTFTKVTTGFVAAGSPNDIYVLSPREVWFCGDGGYIYKSTDVTAGVSVILDGTTYTDDLKRIHGSDETIVAVGQNGQLLYSNDRGYIWTASVTVPVAAILTAINVVSDRIWWVGSAGGRVYYTKTGGKSWSQLTLSGAGAGVVYDIVSASQEVMWIAKDDATPTAALFSSLDGGQSWLSGAPRVVNWPVFDSPKRIAVPRVEAGVAANAIAIGGIAGNATDGILLIGLASKL